jgi:hypothetical protein
MSEHPTQPFKIIDIDAEERGDLGLEFPANGAAEGTDITSRAEAAIGALECIVDSAMRKYLADNDWKTVRDLACDMRRIQILLHDFIHGAHDPATCDVIRDNRNMLSDELNARNAECERLRRDRDAAWQNWQHEKAGRMFATKVCEDALSLLKEMKP